MTSLNSSYKRLFAVFCFLCAALLRAQAPQAADFPLRFTLDQEASITVVIEDSNGLRVRNLAADLRLPAGEHLLSWDGYDDGEVQKDGSVLRRRVSPGRFTARGLTHKGLRLIYEFPVNSPGNPPWFTPERTGAWLADHTANQGVVFVPASDDAFLGRGQSRIIVAALTAECGDAFVALDMDGQKIQGANDFGWHGGYAIALDKGPKPHAASDPLWLYALRPEGKTMVINAYGRSGRTSRFFRTETENPVIWNGGRTGDSLAVWNARVFASVPQDNAIYVVDVQAAEGKRLQGKIPLQSPRGLAFDAQGRLLVATEKQVKRLTIDPASPAILREEIVIREGLEDAQQITLDAAGNIFVGDWGSQHNVKQFSPEGRLLRTFGKPGGPQLGNNFDYDRMHFPKGMAVDERNQLWVADADHLPKRISTWAVADGRRVNSFVGGPKYGGGGFLDPKDKTRMYYGIFNGGYTLRLDWKAGKAIVDSVYTRLEQFKGLERDRHIGEIPDNAFHIGENTFLIPNFTNGLASNPGQAMIWHKGKDGVAWPVALVGGLNLRETSHGSWNPERNPGVQEFFDNPGDGKKLDFSAMVIWSDLNRDGRAQREEFRYWRTGIAYFASNVRFNDDLSFTANGHSFPAPTILPNGVPVWAQESEITRLTDGALPRNATAAPGGWMLHVGRDDRRKVPGRHNSIVGYRDGRQQWEYPSYYRSVIPDNTSTVIMAQRHLGAPFTAAEGEAGTLFGINGEHGSMYLMTADGLFLQDLGGDLRTHPTKAVKYPKVTRGMAIERVTFMDEHFGPSLQQTSDGEVILIAGKEYSAIYRVDGLQEVRRRVFTTMDIDAARLAGMPETRVVPSRVRGPLSMSVAFGGDAPVIDGALGEWSPAGWARLDERASASLRVVNNVLYAAWRTGDPRALANASGEPNLLFKRGGSVDIMIAADPNADPKRREPVAGDQRLLVSLQDGKPVAVLYRAVVPGTNPEDRIVFDSPVGRVDFDRVDVVSDRIRFAARDGNIELAVPLSVFGIPSLEVGASLQGDIGLLRGTGSMTTQRLYWSNLDTGICSDIPSEAKLMPWNWGRWTLTPSAPARVLPAVEAPAAAPGLLYRSFEGTWEKLPDFASLTPKAQGVIAQPQLKDTAPRTENYALLFAGFLRVPEAGEWYIGVRANDGARLWLGDQLVVDNDGLRSMSETRGGFVRLSKGLHPLRVGFLQAKGGALLELEWKGPGMAEALPIPANAFFHTPLR